MHLVKTSLSLQLHTVGKQVAKLETTEKPPRP